MLLKMYPEQIVKHWDVIKFGIEESLPPVVGQADDRMSNILFSILTNALQCWISYDSKGGKLNALLLTSITNEPISKTKSLTIYCLYGFELINDFSWKEGFEALQKFARSNNCDRITAYTNIEKIKKMARSFNGSSEYSFISIPTFKI